MTPAHVTVFEGILHLRNRIFGIGRHPDPHRHFGAGGIDEAEALCAPANRDLLGFIRPPAEPELKNFQREVPRRIRGRSAETLRFDSPYPSGRPGNDRVQVRLYRPAHNDHPNRVIVFHHPIYQKRWDVWEWFLADLMDRIPVAAMAGPYHYDRVPPGEYPGESTCNPNPWKLFESVRQWAWDQLATHTALIDRCGLEPAAVVGFSIGAFQSTLAAAAGLINLPLVSIASTNRYAHGILHGAIGHGILKGMREVGIDEARLRRMTESIQLERYAPRLRDRPVLFITGAHDRVDPPPSLERLNRALRPTRSVTLRTGHATIVLHRRTVGREILTFLSGLGIL
jgi:pimeloyl-ACP methyl ester carboxylesterase